MQTIWVLSRGNEGYGLFAPIEEKLFGVKHWWEDTKDEDGNVTGSCGYSNLEEFYAQRKTYFTSREDAEAYAEPIARKAYEIWVQDFIDNEEEASAKEAKEKGFIAVRCEEVTEDDPHYDWLHGVVPCTTYACPPAHEYDNFGYNFASITQETLY